MKAKQITSKKLYGPQEGYIKKLKSVMGRLGIKKYNYNWDRFGSYVEFLYHGRAYKFADSIENAAKHGQKISYVSDTFARVVLSLEDIARMKERGIYDLDTILAGFPALPPAADIPDCFRVLGYDQLPSGRDEVTRRYRSLAKSAHPDAGGSKEQFQTLTAAYDQAMEYLEEELNNGN